MSREFFIELLIAWRYLRGQGQSIVFQTNIRLALIFMSLMVFIMMLVISVFNGFEQEIHRLLENSGYHITVSRSNNSVPISNQAEILKNYRDDPRLAGLMHTSFESIDVNALLGVADRFESKNIRAIPLLSDQSQPEDFARFPPLVHYRMEYLKEFQQGKYVLIGRKLARENGWHVGDRIQIFVPGSGRFSRDTQIRNDAFRIAGFFRTGFNEFDTNILYISIPQAQRLLGIGKRVNEIIIQLKNLKDLDTARSLARSDLPGNPYQYNISTIREERGNFLEAVKLEKTLMMIVMGLLIIAGIAGIWVTVHLLVSDKTKSIGMLLAMGLPIRSIILIFCGNAFFIGLIAATIGGSLGIYVTNNLEAIIKLLEHFLNSSCNWWFGHCSAIQLIPKNIYYFDYLPVYADPNIFFGIGLFTMILSGFAGYFPSRKAARLTPLSAMRFE